MLSPNNEQHLHDSPRNWNQHTTVQYMVDVHYISRSLFRNSYLLLICMKVTQNTIFTVL